MSYLCYVKNLYSETPKTTTDYKDAVAIVTDKEKAEKIATLLTYLFSNTIKELTLQQESNSMNVTVQHYNVFCKQLPSHNTLLSVPSVVQMKIFPDGRLEFNDPNKAPYETVELLSYYIWKKVTILEDKVHIMASHCLSFYFKIVDLENVSTEIPYNSILNSNTAESK